MVCPPTEPHPDLVPFEPAAERSLTVFGATVSLAWIPNRRARTGRVNDERPALRRSPAARIVQQETIWHSDSLVLTPNRYPFAREQRILWMKEPLREPDGRFWLAAIEWAAATDGTVMLNSIGAAASIARAHAHLCSERQPFLKTLPERAPPSDLIDVPAGCHLVAKDLPFCVLGVRGQRAAMAAAMLLLAEARLTAAWNVIITREAAWIVPRRVETPIPWFPEALGAAELWGRWCYVEEAPFATATPRDLEQALLRATLPTLA